MNNQFLEYFRCPANYVDFRLRGQPMPDSGFFRVGPDLTCYGRLSDAHTSRDSSGPLEDVLSAIRVERNTCVLPFDLDEVVENLRFERYEGAMPVVRRSLTKTVGRKTYYAIRPFLPTGIRKHLQRMALRGWDRANFPAWPIDQTVDRLFDRMMASAIRANSGRRIPFIWFWPDGYSSCATMTHDVETVVGRDFCSTLMDLDDAFGIKASFQLIPEVRYEVSDEFLRTLRDRGFEINVHDFNHDGDLFLDREEFLRRVARINDYGRKFRSAGYRSGVLYRNLDWYEYFDCSYDMSVPNVGHLDPQRGGCCTTKPYLIEERARDIYTCLLARLSQLREQSKMWIPLPRQLNDWWRSRNEMRLIREENTWQIQGPDAHRARVAFASLEGDRVVYGFDPEIQAHEIPILASSQSSVSLNIHR